MEWNLGFTSRLFAEGFDTYMYPFQWDYLLRRYENFNLRKEWGCQNITLSQDPQIAHMKQNLFLKLFKKAIFNRHSKQSGVRLIFIILKNNWLLSFLLTYRLTNLIKKNDEIQSFIFPRSLYILNSKYLWLFFTLILKMMNFSYY